MKGLATAASIATLVGVAMSVWLNYRRHTPHVRESTVTRVFRVAITVVVGAGVLVFLLGVIAVMIYTFAENLQ